MPHALVIEDDDSVLDAVHDRLRSMGHSHDVACCQKEAEEHLLKTAYDYVLLDLSIPVTYKGYSDREYGRNLLHRIKGPLGHTQTPVIIMTAHDNDSYHLAVELMKEGAVLYPADEKIFSDGKEIENYFDKCIADGLEGILAKKLDGAYQAGARGWSWIKLKRSYQSKLDDTIDCVVMGYYYGRGKRTSFGIGAFLIGIYDAKSDKFLTIAKVGTGLTDEEWRELAKRGDVLKSKEMPVLYDVDKWLAPDVWIKPEIVVEIRADELTRSPVHTAGRTLKPSKSGSSFDVDVAGYALRFPRLERFRDDKSASDCTSLKEIEEIFKLQKK